MMFDKFDINEKDGKIHVYIEVPHEEPLKKIPRYTLTTKEVCALLDEKGVKYGKILSDQIIRNWREYSRKNEWIFEIPLDKESKSVIIEVEKPVQPKLKPKATGKKRTRSSTKKVSKEV